MPEATFDLSGVSPAMLIHAAPEPGDSVGAPPTVVPMMRLVSADMVSPASHILVFHNPIFRPPIRLIGAPRSSFSLPTLVSPSATPTDQTLFEDPQNASSKFFLTTYALATTGSGAPLGRWVTFAPAASGYLLTVHLVDSTLTANVAGNGRLSPDTRYLLSAVVQDRTVTWDLTAAPPASDGSLTLTVAIADFAGRDLLYAAMTDPAAQAQLTVRRSLTLALPVANSSNYASQAMAIDSAIAFTFSKDLDAQVFSQLQGVGATPPPPWKAVTVDWNGRQHTYFQSSSQLDQVYFLPDAFKVGRETQSPHLPNLAVTSQGDSAANLSLTLSYFAAPVWDPKRLADAPQHLQTILGLPQPPNLALFEASDAVLALSLPGADPSAGVTMQPQPNAIIDLGAGLQGSVTCGVAAFRQIYDALFDQRSTVLSGEVRVTVNGNTVALPFAARIADLAGDIFDTTVTINKSANSMAVALTNAIESPVHVAQLTGVITRPEGPLDSKITAITPATPVDLAAPVGATAGASLTVTLAPNMVSGLVGLLGGGGAVGGLLGGLFGGGGSGGGGGTSGGTGGTGGTGSTGGGGGKIDVGKVGSGVANLILDSKCTPVFDFSQVTVTPDPTATWNAIMAHGVPNPISRVLSLKLISAMLAHPNSSTPPGPDAIFAVQVVFQSGQTASFDASLTPDSAGFLNQTVTLSTPIQSFVLGDGPTDGYTYRVDTVTPSGVHQGASVTDNRDTLYIVPGG